MPFQPGFSGNPGGKARKTKIQIEFERRCQEYLDKNGWAGMEKMAQDRDPKVRMWALDKMMDRGFGKPTEVVDVTTRDETLFSPNELADSISDLIARESAQGNGASPASETPS